MKSTTSSKRSRIGAQLLAGLAVAAFLVAANAQPLDNKGRDFIMAFNVNSLGSPISEQVQLHLTADIPTSVTVHYPVNSPTFVTTVAVNPGAVTIVTLPTTASLGWSPDSVANNCVRAFSDEEFICYMINRRVASSDAALALPVDTMNTDYIVVDYNPTFVGSQFTVVAAFDNTTITITPRTTMVGHAAGVPFNVVLQRGQGYSARGASTSSANSLSGTTIEADRPVGLVNGNGCHQVPTGFSACDHTFEVAQPVASWGMQVFIANLPLRSQSLYRIVASQDNTIITLDGAFLAVLNKGGFVDHIIGGDHVIAGNKPIFVAQYMTGQDFPGGNNTGDPAMGNMVPSEQYLNRYTFSTVGGGQFVRNFLTLIARNDNIGAVLLDGSPIAPASFSPIPGGTHSVARIELAQGTHTTQSTDPHGITVEGYNSFDSYIYPGGALFQFINPVGDANAPICVAQQLAGPPPSVCGGATDNRPSEDTNGNSILDPGEDLNGNGQIDEDTGIFFVQLAPGAVNLTLTVDPFTPGDGVASYCVTLTDPTQAGSGAVVITDGAGNQCSTPITLTVNNPPTVGATSQKIASGAISTLFAADDRTAIPDIEIYVLDSAIPGFIAGPYRSGNVLVLRRNPNQAPYSRLLGPPYTAQVQTRGQALVIAEDDEGATSAPVPVP